MRTASGYARCVSRDRMKSDIVNASSLYQFIYYSFIRLHD